MSMKMEKFASALEAHGYTKREGREGREGMWKHSDGHSAMILGGGRSGKWMYHSKPGNVYHPHGSYTHTDFDNLTAFKHHLETIHGKPKSVHEEKVMVKKTYDPASVFSNSFGSAPKGIATSPTNKWKVTYKDTFGDHHHGVVHGETEAIARAVARQGTINKIHKISPLHEEDEFTDWGYHRVVVSKGDHKGKKGHIVSPEGSTKPKDSFRVQFDNGDHSYVHKAVLVKEEITGIKMRVDGDRAKARDTRDLVTDRKFRAKVAPHLEKHGYVCQRDDGTHWRHKNGKSSVTFRGGAMSLFTASKNPKSPAKNDMVLRHHKDPESVIANHLNEALDTGLSNGGKQPRVVTRNPGYGYHGVVHNRHQSKELKTDDEKQNPSYHIHNAYNKMHTSVKAIATKAGHLSDAKKPNVMVRDYLDSTRGRHLEGLEKNEKYITRDFADWKRTYKPELYEQELFEAVSGPVRPKIDKKKYSWGQMTTLRHGSTWSIPLHPEHLEALKLKDGGETKFKTEDGNSYKAKRVGGDIHIHRGHDIRGTRHMATVNYNQLHENLLTKVIRESYVQNLES